MLEEEEDEEEEDAFWSWGGGSGALRRREDGTADVAVGRRLGREGAAAAVVCGCCGSDMAGMLIVSRVFVRCSFWDEKIKYGHQQIGTHIHI